MRIRTIAMGLVVILLAVNFASAKDSPDKKRDKTRKMAAQTLKDLYKLKPTPQGAIQKSSGYAVFDNLGTHLFVLSTARGSGIAIASNDFLDSGWSGSAQADAAAKAGDKGRAYSGAEEVAPGVWVYQITKNGLALQLTLQGTKYYKDDDLNKKTYLFGQINVGTSHEVPRSNLRYPIDRFRDRRRKHQLGSDKEEFCD